jgi:transcriptional regulator with XRE-family HTH domain
MSANETQNFFKKLRRSLGLTQLAIGKAASVPNYKLARWEKGQATFTPEEVKRVLNALDSRLIEISESNSDGPKANPVRTSFKASRNGYGISQQELAEEAGESRTLISLYENGYSTLSKKEEEGLFAALERLAKKRGMVRVFRNLNAYAESSQIAQQLRLKQQKRLETEDSNPGTPDALGGLMQLVQTKHEDEVARASLTSSGTIGRIRSLQETIANRDEMIAVDKKIIANREEQIALQKEILERYEGEVARLELLLKETNESKDREIKALSERITQLDAKLNEEKKTAR